MHLLSINASIDCQHNPLGTLVKHGVVAGALLLFACSQQSQDLAKNASAIDYNWDVRPILSQNCFACHGSGAQKAGLRLDIADTAYGELPESPGKHAIVPGHPDQSELIYRITATDVDERMPPQETHKKLTSAEIDTLNRWIAQGAQYKEHWAYIQPALVKPAATAFDDRVVNPIDRYVFAKLEQLGLQPSPEADKETLINRVSLTLTGLPPSLEEVDAFVTDNSPDAYERLVDRLLSSKAYAERMAQTWLDVARYADTDGYLGDAGGRLLHPYRNWVIDAFDRNIPYNDFATWQIAGDLLENPTTEQRLATSFLRMGKRNSEGGIIDEEWRVEYVNERTELMGTAFMGLTVGCAKCHDHKYDVISQKDYYSIAGFFNNMDESGVHTKGAGGTPMGPTLPWPTREQAHNLEVAQQHTAAVQQSYSAIREQRLAAVTDNAKTLAQNLDAVKSRLQASIDAKTEAYYPLDSIYKDSFEPLMIGPPEGRPSGNRASKNNRGNNNKTASEPKERLASEDLRQAVARAIREGKYKFENAIAITRRRLRVGLNEKVLYWTPSGRDGDPPGGVNNGTYIDGVKGKAVEIYDTIGFAAEGVGRYDRLDEFSLDLWTKLRTDKPYKEASILYNGSGRDGYDLFLENNHLRFDMKHTYPYNMLSVRTLEPLPQGKWLHIAMTYDGSSRASGVKLFVNGEQVATEIYRDRLTRSSLPRGGHSLLGSYQGLAFGTRHGQEEFSHGAVDEIRVFKKELNPLEVRYLHDPASLASVSASDMTDNLKDFLLSQDEPFQTAKLELHQVREDEAKVEAQIPQLMVAADAPVPRPNYVLDRGLYDKHLAETPAGIPSHVYAGDKAELKTRLDLARWLFADDNPLTARVYVNRLWQLHFGTGIVATVRDFGTQGSNPTHPELLDWLALHFKESGWDIKDLQKTIVMSATYRQSSKTTPDLLTADPTNRYLARGPRYRLPAEMIRDSALFASGLLIDKIGGDSVFPYQPDDYWIGTSLGANIYPWPEDVSPDQHHRRSMYTYIKRNAQPPSMAIFDAADRNVTSVVREISNTPLQALVLLNDTQFMEAYRKMAERAAEASDDTETQVEMLFRLGTRRHPLPEELDTLMEYWRTEKARLANTEVDVEKILNIGVAPVDSTVRSTNLAALTMVAAAVMNSPDAYTLR